MHVAQCRARRRYLALESRDLLLLFGCDRCSGLRLRVGSASLFQRMKPRLRVGQFLFQCVRFLLEARLRLRLQFLNHGKRAAASCSRAQRNEIVGAGEILDGVHDEGAVIRERRGELSSIDGFHAHPEFVVEKIAVRHDDDVDWRLRYFELRAKGFRRCFRRRRTGRCDRRLSPRKRRFDRPGNARRNCVAPPGRHHLRQQILGSGIELGLDRIHQRGFTGRAHKRFEGRAGALERRERPHTREIQGLQVCRDLVARSEIARIKMQPQRIPCHRIARVGGGAHGLSEPAVENDLR